MLAGRSMRQIWMRKVANDGRAMVARNTCGLRNALKPPLTIRYTNRESRWRYINRQSRDRKGAFLSTLPYGRGSASRLCVAASYTNRSFPSAVTRGRPSVNHGNLESDQE